MHQRVTAAIIAAIVAAAAACTGSASDPFGNRPRGIRVTLNGATIVRVDGTTVDGQLHTHVGEESGRFIIIPVNSEGHVVPTSQGYTLEVTIEDPTIAAFVPTAPGAFEGEIITHAEGVTTATFRVVLSGATTSLAYVTPDVDLIAVDCSGAAAAACATGSR